MFMIPKCQSQHRLSSASQLMFMIAFSSILSIVIPGVTRKPLFHVASIDSNGRAVSLVILPLTGSGRREGVPLLLPSLPPLPLLLLLLTLLVRASLLRLPELAQISEWRVSRGPRTSPVLEKSGFPMACGLTSNSFSLTIVSDPEDWDLVANVGFHWVDCKFCLCRPMELPS